MKDYYEILEISESASEEVIHMAYKALVKKYHPDSSGQEKNSESKMRKLMKRTRFYPIRKDERIMMKKGFRRKMRRAREVKMVTDGTIRILFFLQLFVLYFYIHYRCS